jgi:hypothetical protein
MLLADVGEVGVRHHDAKDDVSSGKHTFLSLQPHDSGAAKFEA